MLYVFIEQSQTSHPSECGTAQAPKQYNFVSLRLLGRMAVLLVDTLLIRNLNRNPNPLTAGRRSHIRPVPHGYDQR
ncbi:MAG: hypothetical protein WCU90_06015, partial [Kiritimatiellia bacterium]